MDFSGRNVQQNAIIRPLLGFFAKAKGLKSVLLNSKTMKS